MRTSPAARCARTDHRETNATPSPATTLRRSPRCSRSPFLHTAPASQGGLHADTHRAPAPHTNPERHAGKQSSASAARGAKSKAPRAAALTVTTFPTRIRWAETMPAGRVEKPLCDRRGASSRERRASACAQPLASLSVGVEPTRRGGPARCHGVRHILSSGISEDRFTWRR